MAVVMNRGTFVIDGKETFLYGGECHYFRVPRGEWRDRLRKLEQSGCNLVSTYVPWIWHEPEEGAVDLTGRTDERRDLRAFLELVAESGLYCIVRPGPYVMAEVRNEGIPEWLLETYPDVMARTRTGGIHPAKVVSYRHPVFLSKVKKWYEAVNRVIAPMQATCGGPVIMYQLCNEIGMLHWVTNTSDYHPETLGLFERHLSEKYGSVERFNAEYGVDEPSFAEFVRKFRDGLPDHYPSFHYEWGEFWREHIRRYVGELREYARETGIRVPFIVNVHGFKDYSIYSRGTEYPIGVSQLYRTAEFDDVVLAGDFYPGHIGYDNYHDLVLASAYTKAVSSPDQPLFSAEFQSGRLADRPRLYPHDLDLNTRTCVAHGMNSLNYYMFVAGENGGDIGLFGRRHEWQAPVDSRGRLRPNYFTARHLGRVLRAIGGHLVRAPKKIHTHIGFNPDDYMTEVVEERDRGLLGEVIAKREHFAFDGVFRLLAAANIHFEAVDLLKPLDPAAVPTLWVFSTEKMDRNIQEKLVRYVRDGGKLVLFPQIPIKDKLGMDCTVLRDSLSLGEWEVIGGIDTVDVLGIDSVNVKQRLRFRRYEGEPVARFTRRGADEVAAYRKAYGRGEIVVLGIAIMHDYGYQLEVIRRIAALVGVQGHLTSTNGDLSLVERTDGSASFIFVANYDEVPQSGVIYENGTPLFGGEPVRISPRSGAVFVRRFRVHPEVEIEYATVELTGIREENDRVVLSVHPAGGPGTVKLRAAGWKAALAEPADGGQSEGGDASSFSGAGGPEIGGALSRHAGVGLQVDARPAGGGEVEICEDGGVHSVRGISEPASIVLTRI